MWPGSCNPKCTYSFWNKIPLCRASLETLYRPGWLAQNETSPWPSLLSVVLQHTQYTIYCCSNLWTHTVVAAPHTVHYLSLITFKTIQKDPKFLLFYWITSSISAPSSNEPLQGRPGKIWGRQHRAGTTTEAPEQVMIRHNYRGQRNRPRGQTRVITVFAQAERPSQYHACHQRAPAQAAMAYT